MGERIELPNARIEVEERPGYLYLVETGTLKSVAEVEQYSGAMELLAERTGLRRALIDSRAQDEAEPPKLLREAMWKFLLSGRAFEQIAFVLANEMQVARVNMIALSQKAQIRAFPAMHEAHRWLSGRQRTLSQSIQFPVPTPVPPADRRLSERPPTPAAGIPAPRVPAASEPASTRNTGAFSAIRPVTPSAPVTRKSGEVAVPPPDPTKVDKK
jgi:hypothetical protein